jgi:hypothetical protein
MKTACHLEWLLAVTEIFLMQLNSAMFLVPVIHLKNILLNFNLIYMKKITITLIPFISIFILLCQSIYGQTIGLSVDKNGNPLISINGKALNTRNPQTIEIPPLSGLKFDLAKIKDNTALLRIKGSLENDTTEFVIDSNYFKVAKTISTDNELNIIVNDRKININKPFTIVLGSIHFKKSTELTIIPHINSQQEPANSPFGTSSGNPIIVLSAESEMKNKGIQDEPKIYKAGSIIYDALKLADNKNLTEEDLKIIIKFYFPDSTVANDSDAIKAVQSNLFLKTIINADYVAQLKRPEEVSAHGAEQILSSLSFSSIGGLDVTNIADGLAKFLVKRTKEELSIAFFDRFKRIIDSTKDLKTLFPQTSSLLDVIGDEVYNYQNYIQNLREAFKEDIGDLDKNLPGIIYNHPQFFERNKALDVSLRSACYIAGELEVKAHPGDILANYPDEYLNKFGDTNFYKGAIQTIQLLSESLRDTTTGDNASYWVNIKKISELVNNKNKTAFKIYLGLLLQQSKNNYQSVYYDQNILSPVF